MTSKPPDVETAVQSDPIARAGLEVRRCPTLTWNDANGAHEQRIEERTVVGSGEGVELQVADPAISRLHAELELRDDGLWVRDLGSRNGTFLGAVRVGLARIPDGQTLRMGSTELTVHYSRVPRPVEVWPDSSFGPLIGKSLAMRELFARLARIAPTESTVLIQGETGTGKELAARAIHDASPRAANPFVIVDCASLPETLLESELFGHTKGAFTGAIAPRTGTIEAADGGTVLIDEIGELPLSMQPKLLRVIESRKVRRVGETAYRPVDVRFISATHRDIREMVNEGTFREDLYFRLAVVPVVLPPLRARAEDIPLLVERFLPAGGEHAVSPELLGELARRPWRGNVRELRNFLERALLLGADDALALGAMRPMTGSGASDEEVPMDLPLSEARERWMSRLEREYVERILEKHGHNVTAAAAAAGVNRSYLHRLIRKHGL